VHGQPERPAGLSPATPDVRYRVYEPVVARNQLRYVHHAMVRNELTHHGHFVSDFERLVSEALCVKHCVATANGSVSLFALYKTLFRNRSGFVAVPTMTYAATVAQLVLAGYRPVYYDCTPDFQADLDQLGRLLKMYVLAGAVVAPLYADAPDLAEARRMCDRAGVPLVEDAAQAFLCRRQGKPVGTFGLAGSFSFYANKVVTTGEGGCLVTDDDKLAGVLRGFCNQFAMRNYEHAFVGSNFRMTNLQAAVGCAQLEAAADIVRRKQAVARFYRGALRFGAVVPSGVEFSTEWMPLFRLPGPCYERFRAHCEARGVEVRPCFRPLHRMSGFDGIEPLPLAVSESLVDRFFVPPCHPGLSDGDLAEVAGW
jgi:perosamine synthetase